MTGRTPQFRVVDRAGATLATRPRKDAAVQLAVAQDAHKVTNDRTGKVVWTNPFADYTPVSWLPRWFFRRTRRDNWLNEQRAKERRAERMADREKLATWCPQLAKAARRRGAKIEECEHLNTTTLVGAARAYAGVADPGRRRLRLQEFIDRNGLPGATPSRGYSGGGDRDDYKSERQRQHEWYGGHSELDWRDRTTAEMYGMDVETYLSNYLND